MDEPAAPDLTGRVLAQKYEIVRLLGQGGMGAVYEARNHLGRRFALKLLLDPRLAQDEQLVSRFFREAKASAGIESEHVVQVYDTGIDGETRWPFIVMELLRGEDLEHTIVRVGALQPMVAARIVSQAAAGLAKAHASGIVHRDIKPANIFLTEREAGDLVVKILDFGIAKASVDGLSSGDQGLTKTGAMLGTPLYMSPEQAQGAKHVDPRTDVWSLCMCLYEALAGRTPFQDVDTLGKLIMAICSRDPVPLQDLAPWIEPALAQVVHEGLARDPARRIASMDVLVGRLRPFVGGSLSITRDFLVAVGAGERSTSAPRAAIVGTVDAITATQAPKKSSGGGLAIALGIGALVVVGGGALAVMRWRPTSASESPTPSAAPQPSAEETTATTSSNEPEQAPSTTKTATLTVKMPKGASLHVGKDDWTARVVDGKLVLEGEEGQPFIVSVWKSKQLLLTQKVFMGDGFVVPDEIDTSKGEQLVKPPGTNAPAKPSAPTATATTSTPPAPTKTPPPAFTTFE
jgi:serine/threonine-protein kinase